ncbi:DUF3379 family protein [Alteromonas sp. CYL-A6]|uniref:DUF3379 family protein n=1 Tax=Alteromonas nitratireducens TaxID=3390813 RepID=UPI0034C4DA57
MDELEFRRRVYANPDTTDPDVIEAARADESKRAFWNEQKQFDMKLKQAVKVDVPDDLAHKLIWQQTAEEFSRQRRRSRWHIAMAASVAFVFGIGFTLWSQQPLSLEGQALAHMVHAESERPHSPLPVDLQQVNAKLASFGAEFSEMIGDVETVNYCHLSSVRSLHLIVNTEYGKMSVFIVPPTDDSPRERFDFADSHYKGQGIALQKASIMVVGDKQSDTSALLNNVKSHLRFSA